MKITIGLKKDGDFILSPFKLAPLTLVKGQSCVLGIIVTDDSNRAITMSNYTLKLYFKTSSADLVKTAEAIDNNKGELEVSLTPDETDSLFNATNSAYKSIKCEMYLTATPTLKTFYKANSIYNIVEQVF